MSHLWAFTTWFAAGAAAGVVAALVAAAAYAAAHAAIRARRDRRSAAQVMTRLYHAAEAGGAAARAERDAARRALDETAQALAGATHDLEHARQSVREATRARLRADRDAAAAAADRDRYRALYARAAREMVGCEAGRVRAERHAGRLADAVRAALARTTPTPTDAEWAALEAEARAAYADLLSDPAAPPPEFAPPPTEGPA